MTFDAILIILILKYTFQSDYEIKAKTNPNLKSSAYKDGNDNENDPVKDVFQRFAGSDDEIDAYQLRDLLNGQFRQEGTYNIVPSLLYEP